MEYFLIDDVKFVPEVHHLPDPVPSPKGWIVYAYDGQRPARVRHDVVSRTFTNPSGLHQTNETIVLHPIEDGVVDWRSKVITQLQLRWEWVVKFVESIGPFMWELYIRPGFGFQDTNDEFTDPNVGPFKQQSLTCGGNLLNITGGPIWTPDGEYVQIQSLDFYKPVPFGDWEELPHLFTKQVLAGHDVDKNTYYIAHQKYGDLTWPMVCRLHLAISVRDIEYLPDLPFSTTMSGIPVVIEAYCFQGSKTFGLIMGQWYLLEEMLVSGSGSCRFDRMVYVDNWVGTCPPPVKGFTKENSTLKEIMIWILSRLALLFTK